MSGMAITPDRTRKMAYSIPYLENNLAFVVKDHERHAFTSWRRLGEKKELHLIAPPSKHFISIVQRRLPNVRITEVDELRSFYRGEQQVDGLLYSAEAGSAWTLVYPSFSVVVPEPGRIKIPLAYLLPKRQEEFKTYVDTWLALEIGEGAVDALFEHWILGRAASAARRRWSVLDDGAASVDPEKGSE
jgi:hypothetical protein